MSNNKFLTIYCIYNANGSLSGEIAYFFKKYFYGLKCSMCEITHNFISEKKELFNINTPWNRKLNFAFFAEDSSIEHLINEFDNIQFIDSDISFI